MPHLPILFGLYLVLSLIESKVSCSLWRTEICCYYLQRTTHRYHLLTRFNSIPVSVFKVWMFLEIFKIAECSESFIRVYLQQTINKINQLIIHVFRISNLFSYDIFENSHILLTMEWRFACVYFVQYASKCPQIWECPWLILLDHFWSNVVSRTAESAFLSCTFEAMDEIIRHATLRDSFLAFIVLYFIINFLFTFFDFSFSRILCVSKINKL